MSAKWKDTQQISSCQAQKSKNVEKTKNTITQLTDAQSCLPLSASYLLLYIFLLLPLNPN